MRLSGKNIIYMDNIATYLDVKIFLDSRSDIEEWDYITVNGIEYKVYDFYNVHGYSSGHHVEARCYIEDRK
jgi:hypothetical protein